MSKTLSFLIAEDAQMMRDMLRNLLMEQGHFDITFTEDGEAALQRVRSMALVGKSYDVIISDWEMPIRNGFDFLRQASMIVHFRKTAVLMVTSVNEMERVKSAIQFGVDDYLLKPFSPEIFREKLERALRKKRLIS